MEAQEVMDKVMALCSLEEDEERPYDNKYAAADLIKSALEDLEKTDGPKPMDMAVLKARRGIVLLDTDLLSEGETSLLQALPILESDATTHSGLLIEGYNAVGSLKSNRGELDASLEWLNKGLRMYEDHMGRTEGVVKDESVEVMHTNTLFILAQVHGNAMNKAESAHYCAETLKRQLEAGDYDLQNWAQNCCQLAGFYVSMNAFAIAEYYLNAVQHACAAYTAPDGSVGAKLEEDIQANVELALAKLWMQRLNVSFNRANEEYQEEADEPVATLDKYPSLPLFKSLKDLPDPSASSLWGDAALVSSFEGARDIFNASMRHFKGALSYYKLDGWVTEYSDILMEQSNLYRCLAGFESDTHRQVLMHKQRAKLLEPVYRSLNQEYFMTQVRSMTLELGNIYREIMEVKEGSEKREKVSPAGRSAAKFYRLFLDTYKVDGKMPVDRVQEGSERYFLLASFSLGRVLHKSTSVDKTIVLVANKAACTRKGTTRVTKGTKEDRKQTNPEGQVVADLGDYELLP
eukprot:gene16054-22191_t